ncbi:hypothetical protein BaRGS_00040181 [Batillaria attramentaria]|uniref:Transporter n=1 Tax=Batillaria attramentaria TaxID=370345 RepID=A0ABD0J0W7_9CAEN
MSRESALFSNTPTHGDHEVTLLPSHENGSTGEATEKLDSDDENVDWTKERFTWSKKREYILSCIGYCVGIGNLWRFPYMCQRNGGGAFLLPFIVCDGVWSALFFLEAAVGQFSGRSSFHVWNVCPLMKGAGVGMNVISVMVFWYFNVILAWTFYYLVMSCQSTVPWSRCDGWWNTPRCTDLSRAKNASLAGEIGTSTMKPGNESISSYNLSLPVTLNVSYDVIDGVHNYSVLGNGTLTHDIDGTKRVSSAEEFWQHNVLQVSSGLGDTGHVVWYLAVALGFTLLICFLGLIKGIKSSGKILRDAIFLTLLGEGTSIFGGFAIFSVLGYMAHESGIPIDKVVSSVAETFLTTLCDVFPTTLNRHRTVLTAVFCLLCAVAGLPLVTQGGIYVFQLIDWFIATYTVTVIGFIECVVLAWVYGADRFGEDIMMMIGRKPPMFIRILWCFVTPVFLLVLVVFTFKQYKPPTYGDYHYNVWGSVLGWIVASVSFVPIPFGALYAMYRAKGSLLQRLRQTTKPDEEWGPADVTRRRLYQKEVLQRKPRSGWLDVIRR